MKQEEKRKPKESRPYLASECRDLAEAHRWRSEILREVAEIQNEGLGEHRLRIFLFSLPIPVLRVLSLFLSSSSVLPPRMQEARMVKSKGKKVDEIHRPRMIPRWVMELAEQEKGTDPCFIMAKKLTESDLNPRQNRLLIHAGFVNAHLIHFLSDEEKTAASLLDDDGRKRKKPSSGAGGSKKMKIADQSGGGVEATEEEEEKKKEVGRMHGGLPVPVYVGANKWKAFVLLTRWDSKNCTVLKGGEYSRYLAGWSGVKKGEEVELWGFRQGESGRPCFVLHRRGDAEGG